MHEWVREPKLQTQLSEGPSSMPIFEGPVCEGVLASIESEGM